MLERFTIDILAEQVATQLLEGEPTPKLAHRFFRKGRRDGKRAFDHASVSKLLQDAVHLAGSTLVEELVTARTTTALRITGLQAAIDAHQHLGSRPSADTSAASTETAGPAAVLSGGAQDERKDSSQVLLDALETRKRLKAQRESDSEAAEALAERKAKASAHLAAEDAAVAARAEIPPLKRHLEELPGEFTQRFESIKHTGEILWSRYCNGFVQGEARRGSRSSEVEKPLGSLKFATPDSLQTKPKSASSEVTENESSPKTGA